MTPSRRELVDDLPASALPSVPPLGIHPRRFLTLARKSAYNIRLVIVVNAPSQFNTDGFDPDRTEIGCRV